MSFPTRTMNRSKASSCNAQGARNWALRETATDPIAKTYAKKPYPQVHDIRIGGNEMPTSKEFAIRLEDRPGTLAKLSKALADKGVNVVGFQSTPIEGSNTPVRFVVDNPRTVKNVLDMERVTYRERSRWRSSV